MCTSVCLSVCSVEGAAGAMFTGSLSTNAVDGILSTYNSTPLVPFSPYNTTQVISPHGHCDETAYSSFKTVLKQ